MPGASCTSSPTPWPSPWKKPSSSTSPGGFESAVGWPSSSKNSQTRCEHVRARDAGLGRRQRAVERLLARGGGTRRSRPAARRRRTSASCPRSTPDSRSFGQRSITTGSSAAIGPEPSSCPIARLGAVRDDELVARHAVLGERLPDRDLDPLEVSGSPSTETAAVRSLGAAQAAPSPRPSPPRRPSGRGGCPRARPRSSPGGGRRRTRGPGSSSIPFARRWSATRAGNDARHHRVLDPEAATDVQVHVQPGDLVARQALLDQLVVAELLPGVSLDPAPRRCD